MSDFVISRPPCNKSLSASIPTQENKAQIIADFILSGCKITATRNKRSKAASLENYKPLTEFANRAKLIHDFIRSNGKIF